MRPERFGLGEQRLQMALARAGIEDLLLREGRHADKIPTHERMLCFLAVPAAHLALTVEHKENLLGPVVMHRIRLPAGIDWIDIVKAVAGIEPRRSAWSTEPEAPR